MKPTLRITVLAFLSSSLLACGGSSSPEDTSDGGGDPVSSFTISTEFNAEQGEISPSSAVVSEGETASFEVNPSDGFSIEQVTGCNGQLSGNTYSTGQITEDCAITANFTEDAVVYTVSTEFNSEQGAISPSSATVSAGEMISFEVNPVDGFLIDTVTGCGGELSGSTYSTGEITQNCTVTASFSEEVTYYTVSTDFDSSRGSINPTSATVEADQSTTFNITPNEGFSLDTVTGCSGNLEQFTYTTGNITADCSVTATFNELPTQVENAFCFEGYCDGESPKEIEHNLLDDGQTYTAHYIAVTPAQNPFYYNVDSEFGDVVAINVTSDVNDDVITYEYDMDAQTITIDNPYSYAEHPLITFTVTMENATGDSSQQDISVLYFNAYASTRVSHFDGTFQPLSIQGSKTFSVAFENYGAADSKELFVQDFAMEIPAIWASVDSQDNCKFATDENGNLTDKVTLESCNAFSMSVDQQNDEVTITTDLKYLVDNYGNEIGTGSVIKPSIDICVTPASESFGAGECQLVYTAQMNAFISDVSAEEQAKIDELNALMPQVRAYFEYSVVIRELASLLAVNGLITAKEREEVINESRFYVSPLMHEYRRAQHFFFSDKSMGTAALGDSTDDIEVIISNIEYYLQYDRFAEWLSEIYNYLVSTAGVSDTYGYLNTVDPIAVLEDGSASRFANNSSYGEFVDGEFVFYPEYKVLKMAVEKSF